MQHFVLLELANVTDRRATASASMEETALDPTLSSVPVIPPTFGTELIASSLSALAQTSLKEGALMEFAIIQATALASRDIEDSTAPSNSSVLVVAPLRDHALA